MMPGEPNFAAARYGTDTNVGTFAGSFGGQDRYVFYVPNLPSHDSTTVSFNLIAFGSDWSPELGNGSVTVAIDGQDQAGTLGSPSATGTTSTGTPYAIYPVSIEVPGTAPQLNVGITAAIPIRAGDAFGIGDISVALNLVAPQTFDVSLPASISNGVPGPGAGNLETTASEDDYNFSIPAAGSLVMDLSPSQFWGVDWSLVDTDSGATVASASGAGGHQVIPNLPAGDYQFAVTDHNGATGTYSVALSLQPAPDVFDVSLPASISNGVPGPGAGILETSASEDDYNFAIPAAGSLVMDLSPSQFWGVDWKLVDTDSGATVASAIGAGGHQVIPNLPAGDYQLAVTDHNAAAGTYSVALQMNYPAPTVSSASPTAFPAGASNQTITINGAGFVNGATVAFSGTGITVNTIDYSSPTSLSANVSIDPGALIGPQDVTVTNPGGGSATASAAFAVNAAPVVSSASPAAGDQGASLEGVTITGSGFENGATVSFSGSGITVNSATFNSPVSMTAYVSIASGAPADPRDVIITNPDGSSATASAAFAVNAAPVVSSASPGSLGQGASSQNVTLAGTGFRVGATVSFSGSGITVNSVTVASATSITASVSIAGSAGTGARSVTVTNSDAGVATATGGFTINAAPTVSSASPSSLAQGASSQNVTLTGTGFETGATVSFSGSGITVNSVTVASATSITASVSIAGSAGTSARTVTILNQDGGTGSCPSCVGIYAFAKAASASATSGTTLTSTSLTIASGASYLVFASSKSSSGDGATISATGFKTAPGVAVIGSQQDYNAKTAHNWAWYLTAGSGSGTIKITFAKPTSQSYLEVIAVTGASATTPIVTGNDGLAVSGGSASSTATSSTATASLPASAAPGDAQLVWWSSDAKNGSGAPTSAIALVSGSYASATNGSQALYGGAPSTSLSLGLSSAQHWGTIAVEVKHA